MLESSLPLSTRLTRLSTTEIVSGIKTFTCGNSCGSSCNHSTYNQHNEQARAALKYSSKKPTRRNAKHQADERRKRHNKKRKQHTHTTELTRPQFEWCSSPNFKKNAGGKLPINRDSRTVQTARCHSLTLRTILSNLIVQVVHPHVTTV